MDIEQWNHHIYTGSPYHCTVLRGHWVIALSHVSSCVVVICNSEGNRNNPVVFSTVAPTIVHLRNFRGETFSVATLSSVYNHNYDLFLTW